MFATSGLARGFWLAIVAFWFLGTARPLAGPLQTTWFNLQIDDPKIRVTIFSVRGRVDAISQIAGGPIIGLVGNTSIRGALVTCVAILSPVLPLYSAAIRDERASGQMGTFYAMIIG